MNVMKIVFLLLLVIFVSTVVLNKAYRRLPLAELKRQARNHETGTHTLYHAVAAGQSLNALLLVVGALSGAAVLIMSARYAWWLAVIVLAATAWLLLWAPPVRVGGLSWGYAVFVSPLISKLLAWLTPVLKPLGHFLPEPHLHTGAYELEDLLGLLKTQATQPDNRISADDLGIAAGALSFGSKTVAKVMTPRREVRFVGEDDVVGPLLIDELHKTGFSRFPVVHGPTKATNPKVVGTLYLKDVTEISQANKGTVKNLMHKDAYFINEDCSLHQALDAMLKSRHHMLIVVNKFEELVGVITMEDVLEQIIGHQIVDEFDHYEDLRAVANIHAEKEKLVQAHHEVAVPDQPPAEAETSADIPIEPTDESS